MAKKKTEPLEKDILREIGEWLKKQNYFFWRANNTPVLGRPDSAGNIRFRFLPKFSRKGAPDFNLIYSGRFVGIEVKRPGKPLRPEQVTFQKELEERGGFYCKAESTTDVISFLARNNFV